MKNAVLALTFGLALIPVIAFAHGDEKHDTVAIEAGRDASNAVLQVAEGAEAAVATVERFSVALASGDLEAAGAELDPAVLILESGGIERSRDEYLSGHAKSDAKFLSAAQISLKHRTAKVSGDMAWVASESAIHAMRGEDLLMVDSTESMVLRKTPTGWKIVHIHWSSRRAGDAH